MMAIAMMFAMAMPTSADSGRIAARQRTDASGQ
jgi:hypothetical protein